MLPELSVRHDFSYRPSSRMQNIYFPTGAVCLKGDAPAPDLLSSSKLHTHHCSLSSAPALLLRPPPGSSGDSRTLAVHCWPGPRGSGYLVPSLLAGAAEQPWSGVRGTKPPLATRASTTARAHWSAPPPCWEKEYTPSWREKPFLAIKLPHASSASGFSRFFLLERDDLEGGIPLEPSGFAALPLRGLVPVAPRPEDLGNIMRALNDSYFKFLRVPLPLS